MLKLDDELIKQVKRKKFPQSYRENSLDIFFISNCVKVIYDTLVHKQYVKKTCSKLADYLEKEGEFESAKLLRKRAKVHDNSKIFCKKELYAFASIINDKTSLSDASVKLSEDLIVAIKLHWSHNRHHPEYFENPDEEMTELDIMEMCCDWYSRSKQYKTNFLEFVKERQDNRFKFSEEKFSIIWNYCQVLNSL